MANEITLDPLDESEPVSESRRRRWAKRLGWFLAAIVAAAFIAFAALNSPIGKRLIADQIASYAPASGLKIEVGRIRGDIYRDALLQDVRVSDPGGVFLTIPELELDWRPLSWISRGLDVRKIVAKRGKLSRLPELLPGDPDAPLLPDFDIRVDRLEISDLTIAAGVATEQDELVNLIAKADIRSGFAQVNVNGRIGQEDRIDMALLAEPDGERFDLELDYRAPSGGVIAGLIGSEKGHSARIIGDGTWSSWLGHALVKRGEDRLAAFRLTNQAGVLGLLGEFYLADGQGSLLGRAMGPRTGVILDGAFEESRFDGSIQIFGAGLSLRGDGGIDLANNRAEEFAIVADLRDPAIFGSTIELRDARLQADIDGEFRDLRLTHQLAASGLKIGEIVASNLRQQGVAGYDGEALTVPVNLTVAQIDTGVEQITRELRGGKLSGSLSYVDGLVRARSIRADFANVGARLGLLFDPSRSTFQVRGPVNLRRVPIESFGVADANADIQFAVRSPDPWTFRAKTEGRIDDLASSAVRSLAGADISFQGELSASGGSPLRFKEVVVRTEEIDATGQASLASDGLSFEAEGEHTAYGKFAIDYRNSGDRNSANLRMDAPILAAGIRDVELAVSPAGQDYRIEGKGQTSLGPFSGVFDLALPENAPTMLTIDRLRVWETSVEGALALEADGMQGTLTLAGGGLDGSLDFAVAETRQRIVADISARDAIFGGASVIAVGEADLRIDGLVGEGASNFDAEMSGRAIRYGTLFLGRVAARAAVEDGSGNIAASVVGRQGGRFNLQLESNFAPNRIEAIARGNYSGTPISMPRRAVLSRNDDGQWQLRRTGIGLGDGSAVLSGEFGPAGYAMDVKMANVPLSLVDLVRGELGLGGMISGTVEYSSPSGAAPVGMARVRVAGLSRSGLLVASQPLDVSLVADLDAEQLEAKAVLAQGGNRVGWLDASITGVARSGGLYDRLAAGSLDASMRYQGASEALWRLAALDVLDLSGPIDATASASGTLADPQVRGNLSSTDLRVRSVLSGTDIDEVNVRGDFEGSKLNLRRFSGRVAGGGSVTGSGTIDLANLGPGRGPQIDIRAAANDARLVNARGLRATVTGPLRIVSSGVGGTIAGRLEINNASWQLGTADDDVTLPDITTREINLPSELDRSTTRTSPWRYLVDARAGNRIDVDGLGLDSEWRGNIVLRGTTADPRMGGEVRVVRGSYSFAGTRFELSRGRITFDENVPIDPRLDIAADTRRNGIDVNVTVRGNALSPDIAFTSDPSLPEEEILARLLFSGPITELSATDALQLSAAVASLQGGGGMDPINQLRSQIGLDRLRVVGADPVLGRETGVALGENIGRRFYVELITDGREYSATELEFRLTSWLSLLASVSTVGRESVLVEARRDY